MANGNLDWLVTQEQLDNAEIDWQGLYQQTMTLLQQNPQGGSDLTGALADLGIVTGLNVLFPGAGNLFQAIGGLDFILNWGSSANPDKEKQLVQEHLYDYVDNLMKNMNQDNAKKTLDLIDYRCNWFIGHYMNNRKYHANAPNTKKLMEKMKEVCTAFYIKTMGGLVKRFASKGFMLEPKKIYLQFPDQKVDWHYNVYTIKKAKNTASGVASSANGSQQSNKPKPIQFKPLKSNNQISNYAIPLLSLVLLKKFF